MLNEAISAGSSSSDLGPLEAKWDHLVGTGGWRPVLKGRVKRVNWWLCPVGNGGAERPAPEARPEQALNTRLLYTTQALGVIKGTLAGGES